MAIKNRIILLIGLFLIFLSIVVLNFDRILLIKDNIYNEIEFIKYKELSSDYVFEGNSGSPTDDEDVDYSDDYTFDVDVEVESVEKEIKSNVSNNEKTFIGYLSIEKLKLNLGFVSKNSLYNDVSKNIELLDKSDYPDKSDGTVIIAGHSGSGPLAFFKDLYKLSLGDFAKIYYDNIVYTYKLVYYYDVPKTGNIKIKKEKFKSLVLITCTYGDKNSQTVYIFENTGSDDNG